MGDPKRQKPSMEEVMDELQTRFLVNLPESELSSSERLFFQIEQCYWFYEDFYADQMAHLQHLKLNDFARLMFAHCPLLRPWQQQCDDMFQDFKVYQSQVPVVGCILLNKAKNKVLLVRNWKGTSWSFPRGKVNQGESDLDCARREVLEECGYDVGDNGLSAKLYIEFVQNQQRMRMYLCKNVPEDFHFAPQTRKEISLIQWFEFDSLPKKTWCVMPFMSRLRRWVNREKSSKGKNNNSANATRSATPNSGRAASAPRNRPMQVITNTEKKKAPERSVSTPHGRPVCRKARGHFGTEFETPTSYDGVNDETFGSTSAQFSVEEMFTVNERLTGQKFVYDGNPHDFGKPRAKANTSTATASRGVFNYSPYSKGVVPPQILKRPASASNEDASDGTASSSSSSEKSPDASSASTPFGSFKFDAVDIMACVN